MGVCDGREHKETKASLKQGEEKDAGSSGKPWYTSLGLPLLLTLSFTFVLFLCVCISLCVRATLHLCVSFVRVLEKSKTTWEQSQKKKGEVACVCVLGEKKGGGGICCPAQYMLVRKKRLVGKGIERRTEVYSDAQRKARERQEL